MKKCLLMSLVALGLVSGPLAVNAQYFNPPGNGDLLAGFRKTGSHQGTNELVVYIGNVTNLIGLSIGSSLPLGNVTSGVLTDSFSSDFTSLQWSVFAANYNQSGVWSTPLGSFPQSTIWYTVPRTNSSVQTPNPTRFASVAQGTVGQEMASIGGGAQTISSGLSVTNVDNNTLLVREPFISNYSSDYLTTFMGDTKNGYGTTFGDFTGNVISYSVENITPAPFSSANVSDLYESAPAASTGRNPATYPDPISGSSTSVYYVGYFSLSSSGALSFTRAAQAATYTPPPAPTLTANVAGATVTISFATTNGATYSLIYTNIAGLTTPRSTWPTLGSSIVGTGGTTNFTDTFNAGGRVYSVTAH